MPARKKPRRDELISAAVDLGLDETHDVDDLVDQVKGFDDPLGRLRLLAEREAVAEPETAPAAAVVPGLAAEVVRATIDAPLADVSPECYLPHHVDVQLTRAPALRMTLKRLTMGLAGEGATLASGRQVRSHADAVRWMLERLSDAG